MYSTRFCPYCFRARRLLGRYGIEFDQRSLSRREADRDKVAALSGGGRTYPQILVNGQPIGGFTELRDLHRRSQLPAVFMSGFRPTP